jgi:hypothetical protein
MLKQMKAKVVRNLIASSLTFASLLVVPSVISILHAADSTHNPAILLQIGQDDI